MLKLSEFVPWDGAPPEGKLYDQILVEEHFGDGDSIVTLYEMERNGKWTSYDNDTANSKMCVDVFNEQPDIIIVGYHRVEIVEE